MSFWEELKRRNVVRVGIAYLVVAWLLAQIVGLVLPMFEAPQWIAQTIVFLLILGFPLILIVAWAFEISPAGIKKTEGGAAERGAPRHANNRSNFLLIGLALIAIVFLVVERFYFDDAPPSVQRIAVLPFDNLSENVEDANFAAGLHDEVLNQLAKLAGLAVISRSSVLQYANNRPTVPEIARQLDAEAVVEATVRYAGDQFMVTVQLIDPVTDTHMLSETYQASRSDINEIFAFQVDIATEIAAELGARIAPAERRSLDRVPTESVEAYARYLRARELMSATEFESAMTELDRAIALDPNFAEPYADLAYIYTYAQVISIGRSQVLNARDADPDVFGELGIANANRALDLFPESGQALVASAINHKFHYRWNSAREAFDRALALIPNDVNVLREYADFLASAGDTSLALDLARRAAELDPNGILTLSYLAMIQIGAGLIDEARVTFENALLINPSSVLINMYIGLIGVDPARKERMLRTGEANMAPNDESLLIGFANGYLLLGLEDDASRVLDRWERWAQTEDVGAGSWTQYYLVRGDPVQTLQWYEVFVDRLERGLSDPGFIAMQNLPGIDVLMADQPEFPALRDRLEALKRR